MSLSLDVNTKPRGLTAKTWHIGGRGMYSRVHLGAAEISYHDFAELVLYWLTNTDLMHGYDIRAELVELVSKLRKVPGFGVQNDKKAKRLAVPAAFLRLLNARWKRERDEEEKWTKAKHKEGMKW